MGVRALFTWHLAQLATAHIRLIHQSTNQNLSGIHSQHNMFSYIRNTFSLDPEPFPDPIPDDGKVNIVKDDDKKIVSMFSYISNMFSLDPEPFPDPIPDDGKVVNIVKEDGVQNVNVAQSEDPKRRRCCPCKTLYIVLYVLVGAVVTAVTGVVAYQMDIFNVRTIYCQWRSRTLSDETSCCICLIEYEEGYATWLLPCGHKFHRECIDQWFSRSRSINDQTCPMCRSKC